MDTLCMTLYNAPIYRLSSAFVAQGKAQVNGKNYYIETKKTVVREINFLCDRLIKFTKKT